MRSNGGSLLLHNSLPLLCNAYHCLLRRSVLPLAEPDSSACMEDTAGMAGDRAEDSKAADSKAADRVRAGSSIQAHKR